MRRNLSLKEFADRASAEAERQAIGRQTYGIAAMVR
jgi:hypothetical protein